MELMQLQYFREIARLESFSRAAETLHVSQSALSKSIAKLESELDVKLFEREGNHIHINQFGSIFLRSTEQALGCLENGVLQLREMSGLESGSVRVGSSEDVFIKHLVKEFIEEHPGISMTCLLQTPEQMVSSLEEGSIDFCLSTDHMDGTDIVWHPIYEDHLTVLMSRKHRLADRNEVFLDEFANDAFIITNMGYGMHSGTYRLCRMAGFEPHILYEGYDTEITTSLIGKGLAVQITPHSISEGVARFLGEYDPYGIAKIPLADPFSKKKVGIVAKRGHFQSAAALAFYEKVIAFYDSLL